MIRAHMDVFERCIELQIHGQRIISELSIFGRGHRVPKILFSQERYDVARDEGYDRRCVTVTRH